MKDSQRMDALLEVGAEEIPASYLPPALAHLKSAAEKVLASKNLAFQSVAVYGTARRLTLHIAGLPPKTETSVEEVMGPSLKAAKDAAGAWTQAAQGFARSQGVPVDSLQIRPTPKGDYVCAVKKQAGLKAEKVLADLFAEAVPSIPFPKKMIWNATRFKFARPLRNLVALYGSKVLKLSLADVKAGNKTFGLSHLSAKAVRIPSPQHYVTTLKNHCVLVDPEARKKTILSSAAQLAQRLHGVLKEDEPLLNEVVWLVEHPVVVMGGFDARFLRLPSEVLTTCMRKQQKFFSVLDGKGGLLPHFVAIRNGISEHQDIVRKGYEKVLNARLTDAQFFIETDLKRPLDFYLGKGSAIMLQEKLGSMSDKIARMDKIARKAMALIQESPAASGNGKAIDAAAVERAIRLSKFDLATQMVYEFPELQGTIGGIYAAHYGESPRVAEAVREHYDPISAQGTLPGTPEGCLVSLADKLDGLAGSFLIGRLPSGSSDPYGLRRQSTGILRILLERHWDLPLKELVLAALDLFQAPERDRLAQGIVDFFVERYQLLLQDAGFELDEIYAVTRNSSADARELRPLTLRQKAAALHEVRRHPDFEAVAVAYKRSANILKQAKAKQIPHAPDLFQEALVKEEAEKELRRTLLEISGRTGGLISEKKFKEALQEWVGLRQSLDRFFEKVLVMDQDPAVSSNRLSLLSVLESNFKQIADFSHLQNRAAP